MRNLPAPLSSALARAAAAGECEARVPMEDPPPSSFEVKEGWGPIGVGEPSVFLLSDGETWKVLVPPVTPGEVVRVETGRWVCDKCGLAGDAASLAKGGLGAHGSCAYMPLLVTAVYRIRSVTPERGCPTCESTGPSYQCPACGSDGDGLPPERCPCNSAPGLVGEGLGRPEVIPGERPAGWDCPANEGWGHSCDGKPHLLDGCPACHGTPGWVDWLVRFEEVE